MSRLRPLRHFRRAVRTRTPHIGICLDAVFYAMRVGFGVQTLTSWVAHALWIGERFTHEGPQRGAPL